jgi:hypothetical protein
MLYDFENRTKDMPAEMHALLAEYPREAWEAHPGFKDKTRNWLGAHLMFRRLGNILRLDAEKHLNNELEVNDFARRLAMYGNRLIGNLHSHHGWEDVEYFPELCAADRRFDAGSKILENDHATLDPVLDDLAEKGNRTIKLIELDEKQARDEAGKFVTLR